MAGNWLVVGLGNPGPEYERTRHNLGFMVAEMLANGSGAQIKRPECRALIGRAVIEGETVELAKPQTFMNLSGDAVKCLLAKPERSVERLVVISDDLALPFATIRIRQQGSHGGQNGLRSVIDRLGTDNFIRVRMGIAPEHPISSASDFVLSGFTKAESERLEEFISSGADAVRRVISDGVDRAMAVVN